MTDQGLGEQFQVNAQPKTTEDPAFKVVQRKLESALLALDRMPESYETVIAFGEFAVEKLNAPVKKLDELKPVAEKTYYALLSEQSKLANYLTGNRVEVIRAEIARINAAEKNGTASWREEASRSEARQQLAYEISSLQHLSMDLDRFLFDTRRLVKSQTESENERAAGIAALGLFINTAPEVLRRYDEEYLPQAIKKFDQSGKASDGRIVKALYLRKQDFAERVDALKEIYEAQKAVTPNTGFEAKYKEVSIWLEDRRQEWKTLMTEAGFGKRAVVSAGGAKPG